VGDREANLRAAIEKLAAPDLRILHVSPIYETEPVDFTEQPWFLNCAAAVETNKTPQQVLAGIIALEEEMGRRRMQKKGPRAIDVDILLFEDAVVDSPELSIPHPAMQERRFVLEPLGEIAPDAVHPVLKKTIRELRDGLPAGQVVRLAKS